MSETLLDRCYAGLIYDEIEEYEDAIALCSDAIEANATNYIALNNRAVAYWEIGRDAEAMADFLAATEAAPANDPIPKDNPERFQSRRRDESPNESLNPTADFGLFSMVSQLSAAG